MAAHTEIEMDPYWGWNGPIHIRVPLHVTQHYHIYLGWLWSLQLTRDKKWLRREQVWLTTQAQQTYKLLCNTSIVLRTLHHQGFSIYTVADYSALISATLDSCGRAEYASLPKAGWVQVLAAHNYLFRSGYHMLIHCADPWLSIRPYQFCILLHEYSRSIFAKAIYKCKFVGVVRIMWFGTKHH